MKPIGQKIYGGDIYEGFDASGYKLDLQGWGGRHPLFESLIARKKPAVIIEVGSWKGQSAITMAQHVKKYRLPTEIICIDTWLGSAEHWMQKKAESRDEPHYHASFYSLKHKYGYPQLYYQFLANVVLKDCQDIITPLPMHSVAAAAYLKQLKVKADMIYIDAGHGYHAVKLDLQLYHDLLSPEGVMFGDDYTKLWPGLVKAVNEFAHVHKKRVVTNREKWQLVDLPGQKQQ